MRVKCCGNETPNIVYNNRKAKKKVFNKKTPGILSSPQCTMVRFDRTSPVN
jgi:hypothetical protein